MSALTAGGSQAARCEVVRPWLTTVLMHGNQSCLHQRLPVGCQFVQSWGESWSMFEILKTLLWQHLAVWNWYKEKTRTECSGHVCVKQSSTCASVKMPCLRLLTVAKLSPCDWASCPALHSQLLPITGGSGLCLFTASLSFWQLPPLTETSGQNVSASRTKWRTITHIHFLPLYLLAWGTN